MGTSSVLLTTIHVLAVPTSWYKALQHLLWRRGNQLRLPEAVLPSVTLLRYTPPFIHGSRATHPPAPSSHQQVSALPPTACVPPQRAGALADAQARKGQGCQHPPPRPYTPRRWGATPGATSRPRVTADAAWLLPSTVRLKARDREEDDWMRQGQSPRRWEPVEDQHGDGTGGGTQTSAVTSPCTHTGLGWRRAAPEMATERKPPLGRAGCSQDTPCPRPRPSCLDRHRTRRK